MRSFALRSLPKGCPGAAFLAALIVFPGWFHAAAQEAKPAAPPAAADAKDKDKTADKEPPLPADAHTAQSIQLEGKTLSYTVTVGTLPVFDKDGKKSGEVVFTAYTVEGKDRPVTFALNGGPGAASVFLNLGAIGPKHIEFGEQGDSPSDPATLKDNPGTWLDFTDLVFIDPIGTGFSRSLVTADETKKQFFSTEPDIQYLSRIIYDWLVKNGRLSSRKYLVGRKLRRLSRPADHSLPAVAARRGDERRGAGFAVPQPVAGRKRRRLSHAVDAHAAVDYRRAPGARA